jgi:hypothetical protein
VKREGVIVSTFVVQRPKQVRLFQVKIPREAQEVIGVEMGARWLSGSFPNLVPPPVDSGGPTDVPAPWQLPFKQLRNFDLGEVKLQSYEKANIFFSGDLVINKNLDTGDFTNAGFPPKEYTHQFHSQEVEVSVRAETTIVQGIYRDKANEFMTGTYSYLVNVYVWVASKEDQTEL